MKWTPSFAVTFRSSAIRSLTLAVREQLVTQQESITLKFVKPFETRSRIRLALSRMKPAIVASWKSFSCMLLQWPVSLQHLAKRYRGRGGRIKHGFVPFSFKIGITFSTTLLKISGGATTTLPPRWNLPLLRNGRAVVPSNCSNRIELLPNKSNTNNVVVGTRPLTTLTSSATFSTVATHPGFITGIKTLSAPAKWRTACPRLLAPMSTIFCPCFSSEWFFLSSSLAR